MNLTDSVTSIPFISTKYKTTLQKVGVETVKDLITYFPRAYTDSSIINSIQQIYDTPNSEIKYTISATILNFKNVRLNGSRSLQIAKVEDETGEIEAIFFNQPFLKNVLKNGEKFKLRGKIQQKGNKINLLIADYDKDDNENINLGRIVPEYRLTEGLSKKWLRKRIKFVTDSVENKSLKISNELEEIIPIEKLEESIINVHYPNSEDILNKSIKLLSLYELVNILLKIEKQKSEKIVNPIKNINPKKFTKELSEFIKNLPYKLTKDQIEVLNNIEKKISNQQLLNELVQGDVGSGKTIIAIYLSLLMKLAGFQTVILTPTTILAKQHYENFTNLLKSFDIKVELVIGSVKENKKADILIGTTAVLARKSKLINKLGLIVVDEQHRFGVTQREELLNPLAKLVDNKTPHFVNLTATPIPRTIAETFFGDVEVHTIKTKPKGRIPIETRVVPIAKRDEMISWINNVIDEKKEQVYWICPLVEEQIILEEDVKKIKSVDEVYKELSKKLGNKNVGLLHGKMKNDEKTQIMKDFEQGKYKILVSTTVIEVGIDVANATVVVIENAERFGLAQLHQIRGRVGRSDKKSWCFLLDEGDLSEKSAERLKFVAENSDGLKIAEFDLQTRGPGEVYGTKQSGIPNLKIAKLNDLGLIKQAKKIAQQEFEKGLREIELFS